MLKDILKPVKTYLSPKSEAIRITRISNFDDLHKHKADWNELVKSNETNTIFQTFEWHASWWKSFGSNLELLILLVEMNGQIVGIAPLMIVQRRILGIKRRVVEFIGAARGSDYCDFIIDPAHPVVLPLLLQWLADNDRQWDLLRLTDILNTSNRAHVLAGFFKDNGYATKLFLLYEAPTRIFNDPVADKKLPRKKSLRRHCNYFRRNGKLEFKHFKTTENILSHLDLFFQHHIERRALTDSPSQFLDDRERVFYKKMVKALNPTGWLHFSAVLFDQSPIAYHLGFEYGKKYVWYKPTFDVNYRKHSPGEVLIKFLLEYALERKVTEFDFTIGAEPFKYRFSNHIRLNHQVLVSHNKLPVLVENARFGAKKLVRKCPPLERTARRLVRVWRSRRRVSQQSV